MLIGIDARSIGGKICGVSRVTTCLIKALSEIDQENKFIIYTDNLDVIPGLSTNFTVVKTNCNRMNPFNDLFFYKYILKDNLDVLHVMHSWLPLFIPTQIKKIVTIHDIFSITDPLFFEKRKPFHILIREYFRLVTKITIFRTDIIVTVSNYCRKEIQNTFKIKNKPIKVIYHSGGLGKRSGRTGMKSLINNNYLFYLGNFRKYKNVITLINGYARYIARNENGADLVIAGNDDDKKIGLLAKELGVEKRIHFYLKPDDIIIENLYSNSDAFIFPSMYEGFGIPPIEAMSYGIPVIVSDAEALRETSGNAALVFDKKSPIDLSHKIEILLKDSSLRNFLINKGYENVSKYDWLISARNLLEIYSSICNDKRVS